GGKDGALFDGGQAVTSRAQVAELLAVGLQLGALAIAVDLGRGPDGMQGGRLETRQCRFHPRLLGCELSRVAHELPGAAAAVAGGQAVVRTSWMLPLGAGLALIAQFGSAKPVRNAEKAEAPDRAAREAGHKDRDSTGVAGDAVANAGYIAHRGAED